jgi:hypothetical protein
MVNHFQLPPLPALAGIDRILSGPFASLSSFSLSITENKTYDALAVG